MRRVARHARIQPPLVGAGRRLAARAVPRRALRSARLADAAEEGRVMRVLVVVHGFPPMAQGGSEIYAEAHARALQRQFGDDVLVLTRENDVTRPEYAVREEQREALRVVRINNTFKYARTFEDTYRNETIDR